MGKRRKKKPREEWPPKEFRLPSLEELERIDREAISQEMDTSTTTPEESRVLFLPFAGIGKTDQSPVWVDICNDNRLRKVGKIGQ